MFENGNYVLLESDKVPPCSLSGCFLRRVVICNILYERVDWLFQSDEDEVNQSSETCNENPRQVEEPSALRCSSSDANGSAFQGDESEAYQYIGTANDEHKLGVYVYYYNKVHIFLKMSIVRSYHQ